eukprot:scaffold57074_cov61-Phaeocystis_antarctica.AAC.1
MCIGMAQPWHTAPSAIWMFWISVAWIRVRVRVRVGVGVRVRVGIRLRVGVRVRVSVLYLGRLARQAVGVTAGLDAHL